MQMKDTKRSIREMLNFQDLSEEEKKARGILGRLYGPCASIIAPTRNERFYSDKVWENVFNKNEIVKEMFANGGIPMELDHPADREETCSEKIAAMLPEPPKKDKDGHLICYVDIIDTPMGRIAYQLAKYGFKLGISSRGTGDLYTDENGNESVDPETYDFTTFDLVLLPAVKDARLSMVESLDTNKQKLQKALNESLKGATKEEQRIMKEAMKNLNIINEDEETLPGGTPLDVDLIPEGTDEDPVEFDNSDVLTEKADEEEIPEEAEAKDVEDDKAADKDEKKEKKSKKKAKKDDKDDDKDDKKDDEDNDEEKDAEDDKEDDGVLTLKDFTKSLKDFDKDLELEFNPIVVDGQEFPVEGFDFDDSKEGKLVVSVNYTPAMEDNKDDVVGQEVEPVAEEPIPEEPEVAPDAAVDNGDAEVMESLKDMIRQKDSLEKENKNLKEAKTVSDAEVKSLTEELAKYKDSFARVSQMAADAKKLKAEVTTLNEQLSAKDDTIAQLQKRPLTESADQNAAKVRVLAEKLNTANKNLETAQNQLETTTAAYKKKLQESVNAAKIYQAKCQEMLTKYINTKANMLGVRPAEITSKLNEGFSLDDVDKVCDEILTAGVGTRSLPYNINKSSKVTFNESVSPKKQSAPEEGYEIDDDLLRLAGLIK